MERTILHPDQRLFPLFQEGILQGDGDGGVYIQGENIFYCHEMKYFLSQGHHGLPDVRQDGPRHQRLDGRDLLRAVAEGNEEQEVGRTLAGA